MAEYLEQKKNKPSIDEMMEQMLSGEKKELAVSFISFLRESKMSPQWGAKNSFNFSCKSRRVCIVKFDKDHFEVRVNTQYDETFNEWFEDATEEVKQFLIDTVTYCFACGTCKPGISMTLLGQPIKNACYNPVIRIENPDKEQLRLIEKLVLLRKKAIVDGTAPKVTYISMNKR